MAFIPIPLTCVAELVHTWDNQIVENTLYFKGVSTWDATNLLALAAEVEAWWNTNIRPQQVTTVSLQRIRVTSLETQSAPGVEFTTGLPKAGTFVSPSMPNSVTAAIQFITALRGRSYRGRNYVIGLGEGHIDNNLIATVTAAAYVAAYSTLDTAITVNSAQHVVASRQLNNVPRTTGVATVVTAYSMERGIDVQRRRLPGRGS